MFHVKHLEFKMDAVNRNLDRNSCDVCVYDLRIVSRETMSCGRVTMFHVKHRYLTN